MSDHNPDVEAAPEKRRFRYFPEIRIVCRRTEALDEPAREAVVEVCVAAHGEEDFRNLFSYIRAGGHHFLAYEGEALVGHAVVTTRWLQPEGLPLLKTAYVDAVATLPQKQGRGIGSMVMGALAEEIGDAYEIGCLETERVSFYERVGWEVWRGKLAGRDGDSLIATPEQTGIMILRLPQTTPLDLDGLLTIERQPGRIW